MRYVVHWVEHMRDGEEYGARVCDCMGAALDLINKVANGFAGRNCEFALYELGKQIPIKEETKEEPQPAKTFRAFRLDK